MSDINSFKRRLSELNSKIDKSSTTLMHRIEQRDGWLKQLKDEFNITDETEIEKKLTEMRKLYSETETKLDNILTKMEENMVKVEDKLR